MKDQHIAVRINKPVETVFAFTIDPKNTPKWIDTLIIEQTNEWPPKVGTIYRNQNVDGEWREYILTTFEPEKTFVLSRQDDFHIRYTFTPIEAYATKLEFHLWMDDGDLKNGFTMEVLEKLKQQIEMK